MELQLYGLIAASPALLFFITLFVVGAICIRKGKMLSLIDFVVLNMFSDILKSKKDDRNQTLVYFRKGKVLLQEENVLRQTKMTLFRIFLVLIAAVLSSFGQFAFNEISYNCQDDKDCFEWPLSSTFSAGVRVNCSDPDIVKGTSLVVCYRLVFKFEFAVAISYGMYKAFMIVLSIGAALIIKLKKKYVKLLTITVFVIILVLDIIVLVLVINYKDHPFFRFSASQLKVYLGAIFGIMISLQFIFSVPWEKIIEIKEANADGQRSLAEETGHDNPIDIPRV